MPSKKNPKEQTKHPPYHDFATSSRSEAAEILERGHHHAPETADSNGKPARRRGGAKITFPMKFHSLLASLPPTETSVSWQEHGRAFKVMDRKCFAEEVLPKVFDYQCAYASFQRQLNIYNFMRLSTGPDAGSYYHPLFLRKRPDLCSLMPRKVSEANCVRKGVDAATEPNLYKYSFMERTSPVERYNPASSASSSITASRSSSSSTLFAKVSTSATATDTSEPMAAHSNGSDGSSFASSSQGASAPPERSFDDAPAYAKKEDSYVDELFDSLFSSEERGCAKRRKLEPNEEDQSKVQGTKTTGLDYDDYFPQVEASQSSLEAYFPEAASSSSALADDAEKMPSMATFPQDTDMDNFPDNQEPLLGMEHVGAGGYESGF